MRMLSFAVLSTWTFTSFSGNCGRGADGAGAGAVCICSVCVFSTAGAGIFPVEAVEADEGLRNKARAFVARTSAKGSLIETGWIRIPITVCYMTGEAWVPVSPVSRLPKQGQNKLLLLIGLGQRGNAGLFQDGELREICHRRGNIGGADTIFSRRQVLHLAADDVARAL